MTKQDILNTFEDLLKCEQLWDEMSNHIEAFGGDLNGSKFGEILYFCEKSLWNIITDFEDTDSDKYDAFLEVLYDVSHGHSVQILDKNGHPQFITDKADILNLFMSKDYF
jgi:hypothetical protein